MSNLLYSKKKNHSQPSNIASNDTLLDSQQAPSQQENIPTQMVDTHDTSSEIFINSCAVENKAKEELPLSEKTEFSENECEASRVDADCIDMKCGAQTQKTVQTLPINVATEQANIKTDTHTQTDEINQKSETGEIGKNCESVEKLQVDANKPDSNGDPDTTYTEQMVAKSVPTIKRLATFAGPKDYWNAFYSILFVIVASHFLGRLPYLPIAILMALPFFYMTILGVLFLAAEAFLHKKFPDPKIKIAKTLFGPHSILVRAFRRDGPRFLRSAFAVGVYLFAGLLYLATGPDENPMGWFLMPCLLIAMVAIFTIEQQARLRFFESSVSFRSIGKDVKKSLLRRGIFVLLTVGALLTLYILLLRPVRLSLMGTS